MSNRYTLKWSYEKRDGTGGYRNIFRLTNGTADNSRNGDRIVSVW